MRSWHMLYVALTLAVIIALLAVLIVHRADVHEAAVMRMNDAWRAERAELLNRIQHPEYLPMPMVAQEREVVPPHVDEFERVGTITYGEPEDDDGR